MLRKSYLYPVALAILLAIFGGQSALARDSYILDVEGAHAFVRFKASHLGFSWVFGRFNRFEGVMELDENAPQNTKISVSIDTNSVDTNHALRDKHLRSKDFLDTDKFPEARFTSTSVKLLGEERALLTGDFTLKGKTRPVSFEVRRLGGGKDPWGGYRQGFEGSTKLKIADYGMMDLGPASAEIEIQLSLEFVRKK